MFCLRPRARSRPAATEHYGWRATARLPALAAGHARTMGMSFEVDFNWASQAIIDTVAIPFLSLETSRGAVVADQAVPALEPGQSGPVAVTMLGCGRWQRGSIYRFNAGCNPAPYPGGRGAGRRDPAPRAGAGSKTVVPRAVRGVEPAGAEEWREVERDSDPQPRGLQPSHGARWPPRRLTAWSPIDQRSSHPTVRRSGLAAGPAVEGERTGAGSRSIWRYRIPPSIDTVL